jgi:HK97 family phage portal protein
MFGRNRRPKVEERAQASTWGTWPGDSSSSAGPEVNQTTAMQLLAVSGCVRYITDIISTLPVDVYRELSDGSRVEETVPRWLKEPTVDLDFIDWCSQVMTSLLLHGNAFYVVTRSGSAIVELIPVDPLTVSVKRKDGRKIYVVGGQPFKGEMRHIKGMMLGGSDIGLSPLEYARRSIGLGLAAVDYGQDNFESFLNMPGVIEMKNRAEPAIMRETATMWRRQRSGKKNRGLPGVLQDGATWKPTGVTNEQAQFLQTRQWTAAEIAGQVYLVDPVEMGIPVTGTSIQYGNMEERAIATTRKAFNPWVVRIERSLSALLPQPRFVKLNMDALLRADSSARWDIYNKAMSINVQAASIGQPPVLSTPEMRDFEDMGKPPAFIPLASNVPALPEPQQNAAQPLTLNFAVDARQDPPNVTVTTPAITNEFRADVHVPEQVPPTVTVVNEIPALELPEVRVTVEQQPQVPMERRITRDELGRPSGFVEVPRG